ncbi:MAG: ECF transporter S component [Ruminococcaceae bacterium]|nr:ECF transporter S component [Oscillospiraceae bacterium]
METRVRKLSPARKVAALAMFAAMAYVLMLVSHVIPKVSGFLQFDLKDIPIIIGGFIFGPLASLAISVVVSLIEMITISTSGPIGLVMNILSSCAIACTAAIIYKKWQSIKGAVVGLVVGVLVMTSVMLLWNWLMVPLYTPAVSREAVAGMLMPIFLPFNLIKGGVNAALTLLLYKPLVSGLRKVGLAPPREGQVATGRQGFKLNLGVLLVALLVVITGALVVMIWAGVF